MQDKVLLVYILTCDMSLHGLNIAMRRKTLSDQSVNNRRLPSCLLYVDMQYEYVNRRNNHVDM